MEWVHVHACGATRVQTHTGVFPRGVGDVSTRVRICACTSTEVRACPEAWRCVYIYKYKYL